MEETVGWICPANERNDTWLPAEEAVATDGSTNLYFVGPLLRRLDHQNSKCSKRDGLFDKDSTYISDA